MLIRFILGFSEQNFHDPQSREQNNLIPSEKDSTKIMGEPRK